MYTVHAFFLSVFVCLFILTIHIILTLDLFIFDLFMFQLDEIDRSVKEVNMKLGIQQTNPGSTAGSYILDILQFHLDFSPQAKLEKVYIYIDKPIDFSYKLKSFIWSWLVRSKSVK